MGAKLDAYRAREEQRAVRQIKRIDKVLMRLQFIDQERPGVADRVNAAREQLLAIRDDECDTLRNGEP